MFRKTTIRFIIIGILLLLASYSLYWTIAYHTMDESKKEKLQAEGKLDKFIDRSMKMGLDLQGGMHIVLELNLPKLIESIATNKTPEFYDALNKATEEYKATERDFFDILLNKANEKNLRLIRHFTNRGFKNNEIIDNLRNEAKDAVSRALEIIRNRVDQFGVSEPTIQRAGQYRIIVELAGVQDPERARKIIQSTALLEFYLLKDPSITQKFIEAVDNYLKTGKKEDVSIDTSKAIDTTEIELKEAKEKAISVSELLGKTPLAEETLTDTADTTVIVDQELLGERPFSSLLRNVGGMIGVPEKNVPVVKRILSDPEVQKLLPYDSKILWSAKPERLTLADGTTSNFYLLYHVDREAAMQGKYITDARATIGGSGTQTAGQPVVNLHMNSEGARIWARVTGSNIGKRLAIVLDDKVYIAPVIRTKIANGASVIEGLEGMNEAKDIAIVLRAGALPAPVDIIEERTVGPSLGRDSINMGVKLGIIAFVIVIIFMTFYYKLSGLLADLALLLNLVFVLAIMSAFKATLTFPGIAGLILTVGMAVDANVLIFERIREELDRGKTVRSAIDSGYARALSAILDANITTLLTALILMQFGTGPIKGFAVTLFWGILSSLFTAIFVTRTIFNYITEKRVLKSLSI